MQTRRFPNGNAHRLSLRCTMSTTSFGYTNTVEIPLGVASASGGGDTVYLIPNAGMPGNVATVAEKMKIAQASSSPSAPNASQIPGRKPVASTPTSSDNGLDGANSAYVVLPIDTLESISRGGLEGRERLQLLTLHRSYAHIHPQLILIDFDAAFIHIRFPPHTQLVINTYINTTSKHLSHVP